jgi:general secretion pathway protein A
MMTSNLNELRLLGSAWFDSECLLTVILCGDLTLPERFRTNELLALGSRIRFRRMLSPYDKRQKKSC